MHTVFPSRFFLTDTLSTCTCREDLKTRGSLDFYFASFLQKRVAFNVTVEPYQNLVVGLSGIFTK